MGKNRLGCEEIKGSTQGAGPGMVVPCIVMKQAVQQPTYDELLLENARLCGKLEAVEEQLAAFPFLKHLGIYGYRRETLLRLVGFPQSALEQAERLEQLRALDNGIGIAVVTVDHDAVGVDVPEDVGRVEALLKHGV